GFGWYRLRFTLSPDVLAQPLLTLQANTTTEDVWAYVNGHLLGGSLDDPNTQTVPREWLTPGVNVIAYRVLCTGRENYFAAAYEDCGLASDTTGTWTLQGSATSSLPA